MDLIKILIQDRAAAVYNSNFKVSFIPEEEKEMPSLTIAYHRQEFLQVDAFRRADTMVWSCYSEHLNHFKQTMEIDYHIPVRSIFVTDLDLGFKETALPIVKINKVYILTSSFGLSMMNAGKADMIYTYVHGEDLERYQSIFPIRLKNRYYLR